MTPRITTILIIFFPFIGTCQINSSIDLAMGIEHSYRTLRASEFSSNDAAKARDEKEVGKLNWRFGFNYNRRITNKFIIKTGARLASVGYKTKKITGLRWPSEHDGMGGWKFDPSLPHEIQSKYDYFFIDIPIVGRFEFAGKNITPFLEVGVSPSIFLTARTANITDVKTEVEYNNSDDYDFNKVHLVGSISFGANYNFGEKLQIFGQPIVRYHFTKLVDAPITENLFNYGIEVGVRRKIR